MTELKITIVTPSFNQNDFVAATLDSVEIQSYRNFEHLVYDAGSSDGTLEKLEAYTERSENASLFVGKDSGQSNAINLGFSAASGEVIAWLNTDDFYTDENVLRDVAVYFESHTNIDILYGKGDFVAPDGKLLRPAYINLDSEQLYSRFIVSVGILQPALFMRKRVFEDLGLFDESLFCAFDYEYWVRAAAAGKRFAFWDRKICNAVLHEDSKTIDSRNVSLKESALVTRRYFGFASYEWIDNLTNCELEGQDGIISTKKASGPKGETRRRELFAELNPDKKQFQSCLERAHHPETKKSLDFFWQCGDFDHSEVIVTTFDSHYFEQGLTLIASINRTSDKVRPVFVYDLGLTQDQRRQLENCHWVFVLKYPHADWSFFDGYFHPKTYGYKCLAMFHAKHCLNKGDKILWVDAGVCALDDISLVFRRIESDGVFFIDHDDKPGWPLYNITFTTDECLEIMGATHKEMLGGHLRSSLMGYKVGGKFEKLFEEAFQYSLQQPVVQGDKHPPDHELINVQNNLDRPGRRRALRQSKGRHELTLNQLRPLFGYLGHRQDQSVFSILAARYDAPLSSAKKYCISSPQSSVASKENWDSGAVANHLKGDFNLPGFYKRNSAVTIQHRGTYRNYEGLMLNRVPADQRAIILGNGPSLKGFDFDRLRDFHVFGMNAAYRYWDTINWYPNYYSCLDLVVGVSHKEQIIRLIEKSEEYGINLFLLRGNLIEQIQDIPNKHKILNFDDIKNAYEVMSGPTISTGSHTAAWAAALGYKEIFLLGIDCNYQEIVPGAERKQGTQLEIVEDKKNPNYFFDGYQKKGDVYNIPNPDKEIHLVSWRELATIVARTSTSSILNANLVSKVDAFDFCEFSDIEEGGVVRTIDRHTIFPHLDQKNVPANIALGDGYPRIAHATIDETDLIANLVQEEPDGVMIDVGAHHGSSAKPFLEQGWQVICFEPDSQNRARLVRNVGKHPNVTIDSNAVSDESGVDKSFFTSVQSSGISGLLDFHDSHQMTSTVNVVTLASSPSTRAINHVNFLKIDVEGYDLAVIKGAPWDRWEPDIIECEFEDAKTKHLGHTWTDIADYLVSKGYTVYVSEWHPIQKYGVPHDWFGLKKYPCWLRDPAAWGNLLAFKVPPKEEKLRDALNGSIKTGKWPRTAKGDRSATGEVKRALNKADSLVERIRENLDGASEDRQGFYQRLSGAIRSRSEILYRLSQFLVHSKRVISASRKRLLAVLVLFFLPLLIAALPISTLVRILLLSLSTLVVIGTVLVCALSYLQRLYRDFLTNQERARRVVEEMLDARAAEQLIRVEDNVARIENQMDKFEVQIRDEVKREMSSIREDVKAISKTVQKPNKRQEFDNR